MRLRLPRVPSVPVNALGQPATFEQARWTVRQYEPRRYWRYELQGIVRCLPYFVAAPAIVVVNVVLARGVLLGIITGLLALIAGPISGFAWSRRLWEAPMLAAYQRATWFDPATPTFTVNIRNPDLDAAWRAVYRAGLIAIVNRAGNDVFDTRVILHWPATRGPVDAEAQKREVYDMFLSAGILARDGDHVIGRDPEPA
jgi:hypothetical protein